MKNVLYREVAGDGAKWEIQADKASYVHEDNQAIFEEPKVKFFLSDGKKLIMTAERGRLNTVSKDIQVSGHVVIDAGSGEQMKTDYLQYIHDDERLYTEAPVMMETPLMLIEGLGMSLSLKDMDMVLFSNVFTKIK